MPMMPSRLPSSLKAALEYLLAEKLDNLSVRQLNVMIEIAKGPMTVRDMAKRMDVAKPTISRAADRLEAEGLAERADDPEDGRSMLLKITADGMALVACLAQASGG